MENQQRMALHHEVNLLLDGDPKSRESRMTIADEKLPPLRKPSWRLRHRLLVVGGFLLALTFSGTANALYVEQRQVAEVASQYHVVLEQLQVLKAELNEAVTEARRTQLTVGTKVLDSAATDSLGVKIDASDAILVRPVLPMTGIKKLQAAQAVLDEATVIRDEFVSLVVQLEISSAAALSSHEAFLVKQLRDASDQFRLEKGKLESTTASAISALEQSAGKVVNNNNRETLAVVISDAQIAGAEPMPDEVDLINRATTHMLHLRVELEKSAKSVETDVAAFEAEQARLALVPELDKATSNLDRIIITANQLLAGSEGKVDEESTRVALAAEIAVAERERAAAVSESAAAYQATIERYSRVTSTLATKVEATNGAISARNRRIANERAAAVPRASGTGSTTSSSSSSGSMYFKNCTEAKAAGHRRMGRDHPGYRPALDRDNDGIACE